MKCSPSGLLQQRYSSLLMSSTAAAAHVCRLCCLLFRLCCWPSAGVRHLGPACGGEAVRQRGCPVLRTSQLLSLPALKTSISNVQVDDYQKHKVIEGQEDSLTRCPREATFCKLLPRYVRGTMHCIVSSCGKAG